MFDDDFDDIPPDPMDLIRFNADRGEINNVPEEDRVDYIMVFELVDNWTREQKEQVFQAKGDSHASNKANLLLRLGVEGTGYTWENLELYRIGSGKVEDNGLCTCPSEDERDLHCPTHGRFRVRPWHLARKEKRNGS